MDLPSYLVLFHLLLQDVNGYLLMNLLYQLNQLSVPDLHADQHLLKLMTDACKLMLHHLSV